MVLLFIVMEYFKNIILKNGKTCIIRNGREEDGKAVLDNFILSHGETDNMLSYPDEIDRTAAQESEFLREKQLSPNEVMIVAEVEGRIVGVSGIDCVGTKYKMRHRAVFGIHVEKAFWGLGIGRAMTQACIECAVRAGYSQLELDVVSDNRSACNLYRSEGFTEFGRNPRGFKSRSGAWQELVLMRKVLD